MQPIWRWGVLIFFALIVFCFGMRTGIVISVSSPSTPSSSGWHISSTSSVATSRASTMLLITTVFISSSVGLIRIMIMMARTAVFVGEVPTTVTRRALFVMRAMVKVITPTLRVREQDCFVLTRHLRHFSCKSSSLVWLIQHVLLAMHCGILVFPYSYAVAQVQHLVPVSLTIS